MKDTRFPDFTDAWDVLAVDDDDPGPPDPPGHAQTVLFIVLALIGLPIVMAILHL